jgi:4-alpha-glucanotransferase
LWCIPHGHSPAEGAYLRYDHEAMVSILLLEAHRAGAFVVGEDLGVVEPFVRDYLADRGVLGTSILWFEVNDDGAPRAPETYRRLCMATVATHDLPPTAGYLTGEHVKLRDELGLLTQPLEQEQQFAAAEREKFLSALRRRGLLGDAPTPAETVIALHRFIAQSPSLMLGVSVTDMVGDRRAQNQPGTDTEYPNWRIPLTDSEGEPVLLEDLVEHPQALRLAEVMRAETG